MVEENELNNLNSDTNDSQNSGHFEDFDLDSAVSNEKADKVKVYTSLVPADAVWLEEISNRMGVTRSEAIRRLVYNARMRDAFDGEELI